MKEKKQLNIWNGNDVREENKKKERKLSDRMGNISISK